MQGEATFAAQPIKTRLPDDAKQVTSICLPKSADHAQNLDLRRLRASWRRLPDINMRIACSRAPDGVVNALPTVVEIPLWGRFHEVGMPGRPWLSLDHGQALPGWFSQLLDRIDGVPSLKRDLVYGHILQGASSRVFQAKPVMREREGRSDGMVYYSLEYEVERPPSFNEADILRPDVDGFVEAMEALGLSCECGIQAGTVKVTALSLKGQYTLVAACRIIMWTTGSLVEPDGLTLSVVLGGNEPSFATLNALWEWRKHADNWTSQAEHQEMLDRFLSELPATPPVRADSIVHRLPLNRR